MLPTLMPSDEAKEEEVSDDDDRLLEGDDQADEGDSLLSGKHEAEEDDFFLTGPKVGGKLAGLRAQVDQVTSTMRDNVTAVIGRGQNLADLHDRSQRLDMTSAMF